MHILRLLNGQHVECPTAQLTRQPYVLTATADRLMKEVDNKTLVDVGAGNELYLGISSTKLNTAIRIAQENGYKINYVNVTQLGTGKETTMKVLSPEGMTSKEVWARRGEIQPVQSFTEDGGSTWETVTNRPDQSVLAKRVMVNYAEDGGADADGVLYLRRGVEDLDMGSSNYAQVRVQIGDSHYLKGMAMYRDDLPAGVDIVFNTNKKKADPKIKTDLDAMKKVETKKSLTKELYADLFKAHRLPSAAGAKSLREKPRTTANNKDDDKE